MRLFRNRHHLKAPFPLGLRIAYLMMVLLVFGGPLVIHALASVCCMQGCDKCPHCAMTRASLSAGMRNAHPILSADQPVPACCTDASKPPCRMEAGWDPGHIGPCTLSTRQGNPHLSTPWWVAAKEPVSVSLFSGFCQTYTVVPPRQLTHLYKLTQTFLI